jgi:hypothetical protein
MLAHGFTTERMIDLVRAGLATATAARVVAGGHTIELARVRITEAGRRVKAGGYENGQCLSDNQRLAKAVGLLRCRGARAAEARLADPVSSSEARRTFAANLRRLSSHGTGRPTRFISAAGKSHCHGRCNRRRFVYRPVASAYELYSEADYGFNAKGLDSQAAEPRFPAPISGKDIRTLAKVGRDERL